MMTVSRIKEIEKRFTELVNSISMEVSECLHGAPWNREKILRLYPEAKRLGEEILAEYEKLGDSRGAKSTKLTLDLLEMWIGYAKRGRCR